MLGEKWYLFRSNSKLNQNWMVVAGAVAGCVLHDLAADDLDGIIGQNVIDAHCRTLVYIYEVGRNRIAPSARWHSILEPEFPQCSKHLPATFNELIHCTLWVRREISKGFDQLGAINVILWTDAVEIPADDHRPSHTLDQLSKIECLVFWVARRMGMI